MHDFINLSTNAIHQYIIFEPNLILREEEQQQQQEEEEVEEEEEEEQQQQQQQQQEPAIVERGIYLLNDK